MPPLLPFPGRDLPTGVEPYHLLQALRLLAEAGAFAVGLGLPDRGLAVPPGAFAQAGIPSEALRWLRAKGLAESAPDPPPAGLRPRPGPAPPAGPPEDGSLLLTEPGRRLVLMLPPEGTPADLLRRVALVAPVRPSWDARRRELWFGEELVKCFGQPAPNQGLILAAFEEEGWPARIDDPLPGAPGIDPSGRLNDAITKLNRGHRVRRIWFRGDGTGTGIRWEEWR